METNKEVQKLLAKVKAAEKGEKLDLSANEDLSIAVMNLVAIEEHLFFSGAKTGNSKYYDLLNEVREMRKELLKKIIKDYQGEDWCISKHLLASAMRLMEVGTKKLGEGKRQEAQDLFKNSYKLWNMFWGLNLGLIETVDAMKTEQEDQEINLEKGKKASVFDSLGKIIQKILDCCRE